MQVLEQKSRQSLPPRGSLAQFRMEDELNVQQVTKRSWEGNLWQHCDGSRAGCSLLKSCNEDSSTIFGVTVKNLLSIIHRLGACINRPLLWFQASNPKLICSTMQLKLACHLPQK